MTSRPTHRLGGLLLHPTSLPGPHGNGDFGPAAFHFVDWLAAAGIGAWQVLPLVPPGAGDSPYASVSAFAGSPLLVALEPLVERGWLGADRLAQADAFDADRVDFARVAPWRLARLREAHAGFLAQGGADDVADFAAFSTAEAAWLGDHALFTAFAAKK